MKRILYIFFVIVTSLSAANSVQQANKAIETYKTNMQRDMKPLMEEFRVAYAKTLGSPVGASSQWVKNADGTSNMKSFLASYGQVSKVDMTYTILDFPTVDSRINEEDPAAFRKLKSSYKGIKSLVEKRLGKAAKGTPQYEYYKAAKEYLDAFNIQTDKSSRVYEECTSILKRMDTVRYKHNRALNSAVEPKTEGLYGFNGTEVYSRNGNTYYCRFYDTTILGERFICEEDYVTVPPQHKSINIGKNKKGKLCIIGYVVKTKEVDKKNGIGGLKKVSYYKSSPQYVKEQSVYLKVYDTFKKTKDRPILYATMDYGKYEDEFNKMAKWIGIDPLVVPQIDVDTKIAKMNELHAKLAPLAAKALSTIPGYAGGYLREKDRSRPNLDKGKGNVDVVFKSASDPTQTFTVTTSGIGQYGINLMPGTYDVFHGSTKLVTCDVVANERLNLGTIWIWTDGGLANAPGQDPVPEQKKSSASASNSNNNSSSSASSSSSSSTTAESKPANKKKKKIKKLGGRLKKLL